jgi:hypothetical protein
MTAVVMSAAWASTMRRSVATYQAAHGGGARSLLLAVIGAAVLDLADPDQAQAAAGYFLSPLYRHHVEALGLPGDYLPTGVTWPLLTRIAGVTE